IQTVLTWLPAAFHDAPGLEWSHLPSRVMGYLIACATDNPDVLPIVLAVGCAMNSMKSTTLLTYCGRLTRLLRQLRTKANMKNVAELGTHHIWDRFVAGRTLSLSEVGVLVVYETLASVHIRTYLENLDTRQRMIWETYALPQLPTGFLNKQGHVRAAIVDAQQRRKEQSDVLAPLF